MKRFLALFLSLLFCLIPLSVPAEEAGTVSEDYDPMWQLAEPYGFKFGGAFSYDDMRNQTFMNFLARQAEKPPQRVENLPRPGCPTWIA